MCDPTANALMAAASCNTLLASIDRMEVMIGELIIPASDLVWLRRYDVMKAWILDIRGVVLDIKSRL